MPIDLQPTLTGELLELRPLRPEERGVVKGTLDDALSHFRAEPAAAAALVAVGEKKAAPSLDIPTLADWTMIANQLINLE